VSDVKTLATIASLLCKSLAEFLWGLRYVNPSQSMDAQIEQQAGIIHNHAAELEKIAKPYSGWLCPIHDCRPVCREDADGGMTWNLCAKCRTWWLNSEATVDFMGGDGRCDHRDRAQEIVDHRVHACFETPLWLVRRYVLDDHGQVLCNQTAKVHCEAHLPDDVAALAQFVRDHDADEVNK
jgi:hypothetical protein